MVPWNFKNLAPSNFGVSAAGESLVLSEAHRIDRTVAGLGAKGWSSWSVHLYNVSG